jgi:hypothetical protein
MPIELGFYIREIILLPKLPPPMPQTGFQYFVIHWSKEEGDTKWTNWTDYKKGGYLSRQKVKSLLKSSGMQKLGELSVYLMVQVAIK